MPKEKVSYPYQIILGFRKYLLAGLLVMVPIGVTILVLAWIFTTIDGILQPIIEDIFGQPIIGLGFGVTLALVIIVGMIASNYVGRRLIKVSESGLAKVPIFKQLYTGAKQVMESLSGTGSFNKAAFREVVLVEFPSNGMTHIAFITNEFTADDGQKLFAVYMPSTPLPWSGFSGIVTEDMLVRTHISVDEALKMVISGVMIAPSSLHIGAGDKYFKRVSKAKSKLV
jgi:uncharacterized membrane protein